MKIKNNRKNKGKKPKKKQEWIDDEVEAKKREGVEKFWEEFFYKIFNLAQKGSQCLFLLLLLLLVLLVIIMLFCFLLDNGFPTATSKMQEKGECRDEVANRLAWVRYESWMNNDYNSIMLTDQYQATRHKI